MHSFRRLVRCSALAALCGTSSCLSSAADADHPADRQRTHGPRIAVIDTVSSLGPRATTPLVVGLPELVAWHGHACDGLVAAAIGLFGFVARENERIRSALVQEGKSPESPGG